MENPTTADAIPDRLVHNSHLVVLQGESLRKIPGSGKQRKRVKKR
ncbi:hypothetical protein O5169_03335 [Escherichia coli]|nr:hypothetical protein [Escherichia coli]